jgi:WD40 repeat protein
MLVRFTPDGSYLAIADSDAVRIWRVPEHGGEWTELRRFPGASQDSQTPLAFTADGRYIAIGSSSATAWELMSGQQIMRAEIRRNWGWDITSLAFTPDGRFLAVAAGRAFALLRFPGSVEVARATHSAGFLSTIHCLACSPDGKHIAAGSEPTARVWKVEVSGKELSS